jgi:hypothetical protein
VVVAAIVGVLVYVVPNTGGRTNVAPNPNGPPVDVVDKTKARKTIPPEARRVAGKFVLTAAVRRHLDQAWPLAGPEIRQGMSYDEWLKGDIAVAPIFGGIKSAPMAIDGAATNWALLKILVNPTEPGVKPGLFMMRLDRVGAGAEKHWVVNEFQQWTGVPIKHIN